MSATLFKLKPPSLTNFLGGLKIGVAERFEAPLQSGARISDVLRTRMEGACSSAATSDSWRLLARRSAKAREVPCVEAKRIVMTSTFSKCGASTSHSELETGRLLLTVGVESCTEVTESDQIAA